MTINRSRPRPKPPSIAAARKLRQQSTFPERLLWSRLRRGQVHGNRFRRQHPIERYVVDFCCTDARLVIEIDGDSHTGKQAYDLKRQAEIESLGYCVIRVTNDDILRDMDSIVDGIAHAVMQAMSAPDPPPAPPSREGG